MGTFNQEEEYAAKFDKVSADDYAISKMVGYLNVQ